MDLILLFMPSTAPLETRCVVHDSMHPDSSAADNGSGLAALRGDESGGSDGPSCLGNPLFK
jgi:hypothetical protein